MIKITQEFETEQEAKNALSAFGYWNSLYELDDWLRSQCKYNNDLSEDTYPAYDRVRELIHATMESNAVDLMDYT